MISLPYYQYFSLIGLIISDGWLQKGKTNINAYFGFAQSFNHFDYFWSIFRIFNHYCSFSLHSEKLKEEKDGFTH
jgi:hypothetical protein